MTEPNFTTESDQRNSPTILHKADPEQDSHSVDIRTASPDPLLKDREAAKLLEVSHATFWRRVKDGTVPKPIKLGSMSRWPRSEILEVIEKAKAARDAAV